MSSIDFSTRQEILIFEMERAKSYLVINQKRHERNRAVIQKRIDELVKSRDILMAKNLSVKKI